MKKGPSHSHAFTRYDDTYCPNAKDLDECLAPDTLQSLLSLRPAHKYQSVTVMRCVSLTARARSQENNSTLRKYIRDTDMGPAKHFFTML